MPTIEDLVNYAENFECPPPPSINRDGYDLILEVPDPSLDQLDRNWLAGDRIELQVRPGVINDAGGGKCGIWVGRAIRGGEWESAWTPSGLSHPECLPVPEPVGVTVWAIGMALLVALYRGRSRRSAP